MQSQCKANGEGAYLLAKVKGCMGSPFNGEVDHRHVAVRVEKVLGELEQRRALGADLGDEWLEAPLPIAKVVVFGEGVLRVSRALRVLRLRQGTRLTLFLRRFVLRELWPE